MIIYKLIQVTLLFINMCSLCNAQNLPDQEDASTQQKNKNIDQSQHNEDEQFGELNRSQFDLLPDVNLQGSQSLSKSDHTLKQSITKQNQDKNNKQLECGVYKDLGLLFTTRVYTALFKNNLVLSPSASDFSKININKFATTGYGIETSTCILFNKYLGMEVGVSFALSSINKDLINKIIFQEMPKEKNTNFYMIPFYDTVQIYPFAQIAFKPYLGFGIYGAYLSATNKYVRMSSAYGWVGQIGIDYKINNFNFNIDVKRYQMSTKVQYTNFANKTNAKSRLDPITIAIGLGFSL